MGKKVVKKAKSTKSSKHASHKKNWYKSILFKLELICVVAMVVLAGGLVMQQKIGGKEVLGESTTVCNLAHKCYCLNANNFPQKEGLLSNEQPIIDCSQVDAIANPKKAGSDPKNAKDYKLTDYINNPDPNCPHREVGNFQVDGYRYECRYVAPTVNNAIKVQNTVIAKAYVAPNTCKTVANQLCIAKSDGGCGTSFISGKGSCGSTQVQCCAPKNFVNACGPASIGTCSTASNMTGMHVITSGLCAQLAAKLTKQSKVTNVTIKLNCFVPNSKATLKTNAAVRSNPNL